MAKADTDTQKEQADAGLICLAKHWPLQTRGKAMYWAELGQKPFLKAHVLTVCASDITAVSWEILKYHCFTTKC